LLLDRPMLIPPPGAAAVSVTVQESVPGPVIDALLQERALNVGRFVLAPLPCSFALAAATSEVLDKAKKMLQAKIVFSKPV